MTDAPVPAAAPAPRYSRAGLYGPLLLALLLAVGWSAWWAWLSREAEHRLLAQVEAVRQSGWTVRHDPLSVGGWPFRVRLAATDVQATAPSGHAVAAPELVLAANAYRPDRWMAVAPRGLVLTRGENKGDVVVAADAIRLSAHGLTRRWPNVAAEMVAPVFTPQPGGPPFPLSRAGRIEFHMRPHLEGGEAARDDIDVLFRMVEAEGRPGGPVDGLSQQTPMTAQVEAVISRASAFRGMDAAGVMSAWTRAGGRFGRVRGLLEAGGSRALLSSEDLAADADGRLVGEITVRAERPAPAIAGLARSGSGSVNRTGAAAAATATAAGAPSDVDLTLVFDNGRARLGPFTLGPAPRLF